MDKDFHLLDNLGCRHPPIEGLVNSLYMYLSKSVKKQYLQLTIEWKLL
jgi:hypothetical protein